MKRETKFKQTEIGMIPEEWEVKELKDHIKVIKNSINPQKFKNEVFCLYSVPAFDNQQTPEILLGEEIKSSKFKLPTKRILFPKLNLRFKRIWKIEHPKENSICSTEFFPLVNKTNIDFDFLYYLLKSSFVIDRLKGSADGTSGSHQRIKLDLLLNTFVFIPSLPEQTAIAKILSDLDSKIELLQKQNKTIEAIGHALFKHWFVDFGFPNEEGKPYKSSGGEMVDSELGEIPKGWGVGKIGEILKIQIGGDWGKDTEFESAVQVNSLRGVDLEKIKLNGYSEEAPLRWVKKNSLEKRKLTDCDILIGGSGLGPIGRTIYFSKELEGLYEHPITYSNFCKRLSVQTPSYAVYAEKVLEDMYISGEMKQYFTGTSIPNLDANSLLNHNIIIPSKDVVNDFFKIAISEFSKLYNKENMILSQIRNSLLPKLMSGKIRVPVKVE